jgi:exosortase B
MTASRPGSTGSSSLIPLGFDWFSFLLLITSFGVLYIPTYVDLARSVWSSDEQGHGPIILTVSGWLIFRARNDLAEAVGNRQPVGGALLVLLGLVLYIIGRSQDIIIFEVFSQIPVLTGAILIFVGARAVRLVWFPLFFLVFMVPLPSAIISTFTTPLKSAVSYVAASWLHSAGYPIGRAGVILTIGPYQLLVADACAGLNSMFTLEALGLLYMNLMGYTSVVRNILLAILVLPISFFANIIRVIILILVTYYFGDEAGQGFVHGFAGMVLFTVGLTLILAVDVIIGRVISWKERRSEP